MKTALYQYSGNTWHRHERSAAVAEDSVQLVLGFGAGTLLQQPDLFAELAKRFPAAQIATCSTAGEIYHTGVFDHTVSLVAIQFDHTNVVTHAVRISDHAGSYEAGKALRLAFDKADLACLFVLSDGRYVNGSELAKAFRQYSEDKVLVTGGLAGDGSDFNATVVGLNAPAKEGIIVGIGFYGDKIRVGHGSYGGWDTFGLEKTVTRSEGNVLYEIDGKNALELYRKYLGPEAASLPGSALLFPLALTLPDTGEQVVRTILSIDAETGSMIFAGDIPQGAQLRFMKANFDRITDAAAGAAAQSQLHNNEIPALALLVSCVGRKLILQSRTDEEVAAVDDVFGHRTLLSGFYSYGELSPVTAGGECQLHNQTMTITTFYETE